MSNLLFMDESNGNGVYATKSNNPLPASATTTATAATTTVNNSSSNTTATNNISNIMTAAASTTVTAAAAVAAATPPAPLHTSASNEDLSQSLSEYTDADESVSAPTEFLAEFLSAVMLKDYKKALKYCKLILQYEPNNATAKEFYPLILEKLRAAASSDSDENYNKSSSSPELVLELQCSDPSAGESDEAVSSDEQQAGGAEDGVDEFGVPEDNSNFSGEPNSGHDSNSSVSPADSLSVSVDEDEDDDVDDDEVDDDDDDVEEEEEDVISSSGDDLPNDDQHSLDGGINAGHDSHSSHNSSSGGGGRSRSDNTTHSYSSLLLEEEEEDDIVPVQLQFTKELSSPDLDVSNGNKIPSASCSDSESPTEPLTQRLAAILRSKCGVSSSGDNY